MDLLIITIFAIFTSAVTSTLIQRKKPNTRLLTFEQGQQLANRIKATEEEQRKQTNVSHKLNNKILAQTQQFNNYDYKRGHKLKEIEQKIDILNLRLEEKGKNKIAPEEAQNIISDIPNHLRELNDIEEELQDLKNGNKYIINL
jgi:hypothetical protein